MIDVDKDILKQVSRDRTSESHKYDYGLLVVIGGSQFYSGSPALSSLAAFKSGVDMVRVIAPKRAADIIASFTPNLAAYPLDGDFLINKHLATLISMTESAKIVSKGKMSVVIGGGIGRSEETQKVVQEYLSKISVPVVIDADAIHAFSKRPDVAENKSFLITPNSYEFFILTGKRVKEASLGERLELVQEESKRLGVTILLKGEIDVISDGKDLAINKAGSPYLSKGGTGDTLAGIAGTYLAQGNSAFISAQVAAYINGKAGEIVAKEKKQSLLATDLIETIPQVIKY